jgi:transposase
MEVADVKKKGREKLEAEQVRLDLGEIGVDGWGDQGGDADVQEGIAASERAARVKSPDREQIVWRTVDVEKLVAEDHLVRAIWELVNSLDLSGFFSKIKAVDGGAGRPAWDPRVLISLWVYGYSDMVNSGREIARLCEYHPAYQWLTGLGEINYHTICDFRVDHKEEMDKLFTELLGVLMTEGLITLDRITQDGTKIKAYASAKSFKREEKLRECLQLAEEHIKELDSVGEEELGRRKAAARKRVVRETKQKAERALKELKQVRAAKSGEKAKKEARASITDPEARKMKQSDGGFAHSYNVQIDTDAANKIIVAVGVTQAGNDYKELEKGIDQVEKNVGQLPRQVLVDGGYTDADNIIAMGNRGIDLIGSFGNKHENMAAHFGVAEGFRRENFIYDAPSDTYTCPVGNILYYKGDQIEGRLINHRYQADWADCKACPHKRECSPKTKRRGRSIMRSELRPEVAAFAEKMETAEAKAISKHRGPVAEFPNAWIKEKFNLRQFRLRGLAKVGLEVLWASLTYNVQQWRRLCWRPKLAV